MFSMNQLLFVMENYSVSYAVGTKLLEIICISGFTVLNSVTEKKSTFQEGRV